MKRSTVYSLLLGCCLAAPAVAAPEPDARKALEHIAAKLPYFVTNSFLDDRFPEIPDKKADEQYQQLIGELTTPKYEVAQLVNLLKHADPKVRTLAAAALYAREDPKLLPHLHALAGDMADTFKTFGEVSPTAMGDERMASLRPQSVSECVEKLLTFYMKSAHYLDAEDGFESYWMPRKDREFCAGWFAVRLTRATQGTSPFPADRKEKIRAVRQQIDDRLPKADRAWTLLWLYNPDLHDAFITEAEMVAACKELGPERLLLMLRHKIPTVDPDVQSRKRTNFGYQKMIRFVLSHARELLRPQDADALLACETWEWDYVKHMIDDPMNSPAWVVAAAELRPTKAKELLHGAFGRYQGKYKERERSELAVALWRLVGPVESKFLVDWFYDEQPEREVFWHSKARFLLGVALHREKEVRKFLAALIADKRLDALDWQSLQTLAEVANKLAGKAVVDPEELRSASHPFGEGSFHWQQEEAKSKYPKESAELLRRLNEWRAALRVTAKNWAQ